MDFLAILQSVWTVLVMIIFLGIVVWVYGKKRKSDFDDAARLPLEEEDELAENKKD